MLCLVCVGHRECLGMPRFDEPIECDDFEYAKKVVLDIVYKIAIDAEFINNHDLKSIHLGDFDYILREYDNGNLLREHYIYIEIFGNGHK